MPPHVWHRALVFSQSVGHLGLMRAALDASAVRYEYLDGSTPSARRERQMATFQAIEDQASDWAYRSGR